MITQDRYGRALPTSAPVDMSACVWSVRIAATNGVYTSAAGWQYWSLPPGCVIGDPTHDEALDGGPAGCTITIRVDALPDLVEPLEGYQLEVDALDPAGNLWPFHTGPIMAIDEARNLSDGTRVQTLHAAGVLNRGKGMRIDSLAYLPTRTAYTGVMTGLAQVVTTLVVKSGATTIIPGSKNTVDPQVGTGSYPGIVISANANFSSPLGYGAGATQYTITATNGQDLQINWGGSVGNATYYVKFWALWRFVVGRNWSGGGNPAFVRVPDGGAPYSGADSAIKRRIFDTFQTYAAAGCTTTAITVRDPEAFKSGNALVAVASGPTEYLVWTKPDGSEESRQVTSTDAAGVITVSAFSAAPADGDAIRLGTTEPVRAWDVWNAGASSAALAKFFSDAGWTTEYPRNAFVVDPRSGVLIPNVGRHYASASQGVYAGGHAGPPEDKLYVVYDGATVPAGSDNRVESAIQNLLCSALGLLATADYENSTVTGGYMKSATWWDTTVDAVIDDIGKNGLPPDSFAIDTPVGHVRVDAFHQATAATINLGRPTEPVIIGSAPEPRTGVAVISKASEPRNITAQCSPLYTAADWTNPERLFDGTTATGNAVLTAASSDVTLDITPPLVQAIPHISDVKIQATNGVVVARVEAIDRSTRAVAKTRMVEGFGYLVLTSGENVIPGAKICEALAACRGSLHLPVYYHRLVLTFYPDDSMGAPACTIGDVTAWSDIETGWLSLFTDDATSAPTGWATTNASGFGPTWWQRDMKILASYRGMSPANAKRLLAAWGATYDVQRHRIEIFVIDQATQDECRDMAELLADQYARRGKEYQYTAAWDPRVQRGDTVSAYLDGTMRNVLVFGVSGGRFPTYRLMDFAA